MTNSNLQGPNICDEELKQLSRDVADWILRLGRHEEKVQQTDKDLNELLSRTSNGESQESVYTHQNNEHKQYLPKQLELPKGGRS